MKYIVQYDHVIVRTVTVEVEATSEDEAITKAQDGDYLCDDEDRVPEQGIETRNYKIIKR